MCGITGINFMLNHLIIMMLFSCCPLGNNSFAEKNEIPLEIKTELIEDQRQLIAAFTGASEIVDNRHINRRWNKEEKLLTRNYLSRQFSNIGMTAKDHSYRTNLPLTNDMSKHNPYEGTNLYVELPATKSSDEYIILGAHYDSVEESPGASDNATGCALVLGVAQLLSRIENRSKNVIFVFFDQEETGHAGSYAFVNFIMDKGLKINSVHTADQVGWDEDDDRNFELELPTSQLKSMYQKYADIYGVKLYSTKVTSSDHKEWREAGYQAVGITEEYKHCDTSPHHHDPTDLYETVNFKYLAFVTYIVFQVLADLIAN